MKLLLTFLLVSSSLCAQENKHWWIKQQIGPYHGNNRLGIELTTAFNYCPKKFCFELNNSLNHSRGVFFSRNPAENYFSIIGFCGYRIQFSESSSMIASGGIGYMNGTTQGDFLFSSPKSFVNGSELYYTTKNINTGTWAIKVDFLIHFRTSYFAFAPSIKVNHFYDRTYYSLGLGIALGKISNDFKPE